MIRRNIIANAFARAWSFISIYAFFPIYLKLLGIDAFGMIGFYSTLVSVFIFADIGFTAALNRELARLSAKGAFSHEKMRNLVKTYEISYVVICLLVSLSLWVMAPKIATEWLNLAVLDSDDVVLSLRLMGFAIALQLPAGLYIGGLMGLQLQVKANSIQVMWGIVRNVGAIAILLLVEPSIVMFSIWQVVANILYLVISRYALWHALNNGATVSTPRFTLSVFNGTWRYAFGMAGMSVISVLLTQADKLVVSKMLSIEMLGYYTFATTLALIPLMVAGPIALAAFPRFTVLVELGVGANIVKFYGQISELVSLLIIPSAIAIYTFGQELIFIWTGSHDVATQAGTVVKLLVLGQLLQAITVVPYYLALAYGNVRMNLMVGLVSIILFIPLLIWGVSQYGVWGAGGAWLVLNMLTIPIYIVLLHRRFSWVELRQWLLKTIFFPASIVLSVFGMGNMLMPNLDSRVLLLVYITLIWGIASLASVLLSPYLRSVANTSLKSIFGLINDRK